jgi:hypothetical protein
MSAVASVGRPPVEAPGDVPRCRPEFIRGAHLPVIPRELSSHESRMPDARHRSTITCVGDARSRKYCVGVRPQNERKSWLKCA